MRSALDVPGTHATYLACYEEKCASPAEFGTLVPAPEVPLYSWEEKTSGGTDEEADDIRLVDVGDLILEHVNLVNSNLSWFYYESYTPA